MTKTGTLLVAGTALIACELPSSHIDDGIVTGQWIEVRSTHATAPSNAYAGSSITKYELDIIDRDGLVHGTWTITGDTALPVDPWQAVVVGHHAEGDMLVEFHDPADGQCRLAGPYDSTLGFTAEQRCSGHQWEVSDTFRLVKTPVDEPSGPPSDLTDEYDVIALIALVTGGVKLEHPTITGTMVLKQLTENENPAIGKMVIDITIPDGLGGHTRIIDEGTYANWTSGRWLQQGLVAATGTYRFSTDTLIIEITSPSLNVSTTWLLPSP